MYRYDNYTDSFVRVDGEPNTGSTTVRIGVPLKESAIVQKTELTDECINMIADAVVRKLADRKTEPITHDDYIESENDYLEAKCLNCANGGSYKCSKCDGEMYFKDEPQMGDAKPIPLSNRVTHIKDEPQTYCDNCMHLHCNYECAGEIVHKMIDDAVIAEDVYPDLRQRMHDAVDEYEPQTERHLPDYSYEADLGRRIMEQTERSSE